MSVESADKYFERKRDETKTMVYSKPRNPENPGFSWKKKKKKKIKLEVPQRVNQIGGEASYVSAFLSTRPAT